MSCDKLVYDLSSEVEGTPNVFVRKDWINILDNQNQNYNNNQSVIDTSQLSNSNKYMSYREAYLMIPFLLTLGTVSTLNTGGAVGAGQVYFNPTTAGTACDYAIGLKNWFGQIIHSFTLDYNGTTIIQQTPYVNIWNSFKLCTSVSYDDINTQGATIGLYLDDASTWEFFAPYTTGVPVAGYGTTSLSGQGVCNNSNYIYAPSITGRLNNFTSGAGNSGFYMRQKLINFDYTASTDSGGNIISSSTYGGLLQGATASNVGTDQALRQVWKSYILNKTAQTGLTSATGGLLQIAVVATVYLKHIHSFFNFVPLLKGAFMKMTLNLNNTSTSFSAISCAVPAGGVAVPSALVCTAVANPLGGINPLMIASGATSNGAGGAGVASSSNGGVNLFANSTFGANATISTSSVNYKLNISVGGRCLDNALTAIPGYVSSTMAQSVYLYVPAYTFNRTFEEAYLSSPIKQIKYTDIYQYQVLGVTSGQNFNNLITNGIGNIKSVLVVPFYSTNTGGTATFSGTTQIVPYITGAAGTAVATVSNNTGFLSGVPVFQSPFDPAGTGPTSPMCWLSNFNIQVSGQNAIYNTEKYNFEQFNNQLYGQNAVNGGLTDGITSGQIDRQEFDMEYCYYYVNVERMLPVEMSVPKSIQILGQNCSSRALDLYIFTEYGVQVPIDILTGARV